MMRDELHRQILDAASHPHLCRSVLRCSHYIDTSFIEFLLFYWLQPSVLLKNNPRPQALKQQAEALEQKRVVRPHFLAKNVPGTSKIVGTVKRGPRGSPRLGGCAPLCNSSCALRRTWSLPGERTAWPSGSSSAPSGPSTPAWLPRGSTAPPSPAPLPLAWLHLPRPRRGGPAPTSLPHAHTPRAAPHQPHQLPPSLSLGVPSCALRHAPQGNELR